MIPALPSDRGDAAIGTASGAPSVAARAAWPVLVVTVALLAAILTAVTVTGGGSALLIVRAAVLAALAMAVAGVLGVLAVVTTLLPPADPRRSLLLDSAAVSAGVWAVAAGATAFLRYLGDAPSISSDAFGPGLVAFVAEVGTGRTWLAAAVGAAGLCTLLVAVRSARGVAALTVVAAVVAVPVALQSAAPGESLAMARTISAAGLVQLLGLGTWIGALVAARSIGAALPRALPLCCAAAVAIALAAAGPGLTADGAVSPAAVAGAVTIALAGGVAVAPPTRAAERLQLLLLALGGGIGAAASVTRSLPEVVARTTPAEVLTGASLPPAPSPLSLLGAWQPDPLWLVVSGALLAASTTGLARSSERSVLRTLSWLVGVLLLVWLTSGGPAVYAPVLFEAHLLQHLALLLVVPLLLAGGAPGRLLLAARRPGRSVVGVPSAPTGPVTARPVTAVLIAAVGIAALYGSGALRWSVDDAVGTEAMTLGCLLTGGLLVRALTAAASRRRAVVAAIALLVLESAGAVGIAIGPSLLVADWYGAMGWGTDALAAQRGAAWPAWALTVVPTVSLLVRAARRPNRVVAAREVPAVRT